MWYKTWQKHKKQNKYKKWRQKDKTCKILKSQNVTWIGSVFDKTFLLFYLKMENVPLKARKWQLAYNMLIPVVHLDW